VRADLVSLVDLPATLCEAAGAAFPEARHGQSLWPLLTGRAGAHTREHAFVRYPEPEMWTVRSGEWKYTEHPGLGGFLYDIEKDPEELVNRTDDPDCAAVKARLAALVEAKQGQSLPS
jgi:arylsulfatase A-like enzyme